VRSADRIFVLRGGRLIEQGSHEKLLAEGDQYAELFSMQAAAYLSPAAEAWPAFGGTARGKRAPSLGVTENLGGICLLVGTVIEQR